MEVWLTYKGERLRLPITPLFGVDYSNNNTTENLNEVGTINIAGKPGLRTSEISSFFPRIGYEFPESSDLQDPYYYDRKIYDWAREGEPLRLIITETPHNFEVLIDSYKSSEDDGTGDVYYTLSLSEYVRVEQTDAKTDEDKLSMLNSLKNVKAKDIERYALAGGVSLGLMMVGKYDTAWSMAKQLTGVGEYADKLLEKNGIKKLIPGSILKLL